MDGKGIKKSDGGRGEDLVEGLEYGQALGWEVQYLAVEGIVGEVRFRDDSQSEPGPRDIHGITRTGENA